MSGFLDPVRINAIRTGDRWRETADKDEMAVIAERLGLSSLDRLSGDVTMRREGGRIEVRGRVVAEAAQPCIATGAPVAETIDEEVALSFVAPPSAEEPDEEFELDAGELDTVFHDGKAIALGDALADTLALALDPYPRSPDAERTLHEAGVMSEEEAGPFAGLAALKDKLEKKGD